MAHSRGVAAGLARFALSGRISDGFVVDGDWIVRRTTTGEQRLVPLSAVELTGRHMLNNVLAATAVATLTDCPLGNGRGPERVPWPRPRDGAGR